MSVANKSSRWCYNYETTPETSVINDATDTTYQFGHYTDDMKEWTPPSTENSTIMYYNYASREGQLTKLDKKFPTFTHPYCPVSPIFLSRFTKNPTDAEPMTGQMLDTGLTYPITIRHEQREGTTPKHNQAVGCYTIGMTMTMRFNEPLKVEEEFAWCKLEDQGDEPMLTTAPSADTACSVPGVYNGTPELTWNSVAQNSVVGVVYNQKQVFKVTYDPVNDVQSIKLYEYEKPQLMVDAIFKANTVWDDFNDRTARTMVIKVYKPDGTTYIELTFTNALITKFEETGIRNRGHYLARLYIDAEAMTWVANQIDNDNFSQWFKGAVA